MTTRMSVFHALRASVAGLAAVALALLITACSPPSGPAGAASTRPPAAADTAGAVTAAPTVSLTDANRYEPASITVPKGATVTWKNVSSVPHTITTDQSKAANMSDASVPSGAQPWDSGSVNGGQSYSHTFDVPGTYRYFCLPHESLGMVGTIVVTN